MKRLGPPRNYRLYADQMEWLKRKAKEDGQSAEAVIIRRLIEREMKAESESKGKRFKRAS